MVRKLVLAAAVSALALLAAQGASAKGDIQICGVSGCAVLSTEGQAPAWLFAAPRAAPPVTAPAPAPYFVVSFGDVGGSPLAYWIPSASMLRLQGQPWRWVPALSSDEAVLRDKTAGLQPYAPPAHPSIYVDYHAVKRCDGYLRLLSMGTPVSVSPYAGNWLEIWFMGAHGSPWTDGTSSLAISAKGRLLRRDGQVFRIPLSVAQRVRARLPLY